MLQAAKTIKFVAYPLIAFWMFKSRAVVPELASSYRAQVFGLFVAERGVVAYYKHQDRKVAEAMAEKYVTGKYTSDEILQKQLK